jgi:hypothetical protein
MDGFDSQKVAIASTAPDATNTINQRGAVTNSMDDTGATPLYT